MQSRVQWFIEGLHMQPTNIQQVCSCTSTFVLVNMLLLVILAS